MSMATAALIRQEANLPSSVEDSKFTSAISNAEDEIRRILYNLEALVIDYEHLEDTLDTFSEDGGDTYKLTYTHITYLALGFDNSSNSNYTSLITDINSALSENGQDALTDDDKYQLRQAGRDFRKAEVLLALSFYALIGNLRPTNEGGFINEISFGSGKATLLNQQESLKLSRKFRHEAYKQIFPHLKDPESDIIKDSIDYSDGSNVTTFYPDSFTHPDINISAVPTTSKYKTKNPRERYSG